MPLRDHFRPPVTDLANWDVLHGGWPMVIVQQLNRVLPPGYMAGPRVYPGTRFEIDVATFDHGTFRSGSVGLPDSDGGVAVWAPATPSVDVETDIPDFDEYEVNIYEATAEKRLVAAIKLVSPANKDRPEHRRIFVAKCASLLASGVSVSIVDVVTTRHINLYAELLDLIGQADSSNGPPQPTYAAACRWSRNGERMKLRTWSHRLAVGSPLPTLPLWLSPTLVIPLDLEASYEQACRDLRIT